MRRYWLYTACGLVQIPRLALQRWTSDSTRHIEATVFDASDGVRSRGLQTGFTPRVSQSSDGRLWFVNVEGVSIVDPIHLPINTMPPAVRIEQIIANQKTLDASAQVQLPASIRDLEIGYTALSFVTPRRCGSGSSSRDAIALAGRGHSPAGLLQRSAARPVSIPRTASNNDGVWDEAGL